ncbi:Endoribonuclease Dicer [Eumeta japonica]|uniref:Endoribonuclease Dicer n=1 Tax=Eumeta variegata TaxID=151549 RepID=A0A4C1SUQ6_EUMVA|nr:Endoribonuclease Dicer [Eumeta japonica]
MKALKHIKYTGKQADDSLFDICGKTLPAKTVFYVIKNYILQIAELRDDKLQFMLLQHCIVIARLAMGFIWFLLNRFKLPPNKQGKQAVSVCLPLQSSVREPIIFLLEVKSLTHRRNFFNNASNKSFEQRKDQNKVILVPELCHNYKYPADLWLKALFLPTILHRVFYMLHAESLRRRINKFLNLDQYFQNYTPSPLEIDESLKRVLDDEGNLVKEKEHPKTVLPSLQTKKQSANSFKKIRLDNDESMWKEYLEPTDLLRNVGQVYPVELDYYHKFIMSLLPELESLKICDEMEYSKSQFDMPSQSDLVNKEIKGLTNNLKQLAITGPSEVEKIEIDMLKRNVEPDHCLKSAEQYEFLAAITAARVNDVFDMERFELLDDDCSEDGNDDTLDDECDETASSQCGKTRYNMAENIDVPKALGDIVEALIAAVYLDCRDLNKTWKCLKRLYKADLQRMHEEVCEYLPFSWANVLASKNVTSLASSKSFLFPTNRITILGLANVRASLSQFVKALNESLDVVSYTRRAPAAPDNMNG